MAPCGSWKLADRRQRNERTLMDTKTILERLIPIFRDVFDDDSLVLSADLTADDVQGWDSMAHIRLVLQVEREFSIKFSAGEVGKLKNVGELVELIERKV